VKKILSTGWSRGNIDRGSELTIGDEHHERERIAEEELEKASD
jgi:hypothetical protein